jgi:hypothetical protein
MRKDYRIAFWVFIITLFIGGALAVELANEKTQVHTIRSNEKVEKVHGDQDGFTTEVYYLVTTDKGAYKVVMDGFNAAPQCAGVKKDSTYTLTTRVIEIPFLGIYQKIIRVE